MVHSVHSFIYIMIFMVHEKHQNTDQINIIEDKLRTDRPGNLNLAYV